MKTEIREVGATERLANKLIIYDSNCKMCTAMKNILITVAPYVAKQVIAFKDLSLDYSEKVDPERFRNEMAVIDKGQRETRYGAAGIGFIFGAKSGLFRALFSRTWFNNLFTFLYKVLASNRYIIALPKSSFQCDCHPVNVFKYRLAYIIIAITISLILTALFGISLQGFFPGITYLKAAVEMLLIAGSGWVIQIGLALIVMNKNALDYIGHLGSIMVVGLLILIPSILIETLFSLKMYWIPAVSVMISSGAMLYLHIHRARALQLSIFWNISWFIFLQITALFWAYQFHLNF
jgi:predicted DCC family thiol-disulfide oxidoreductase YuxK